VGVGVRVGLIGSTVTPTVDAPRMLPFASSATPIMAWRPIAAPVESHVAKSDVPLDSKLPSI
jgi:hypothetical protein